MSDGEGSLKDEEEVGMAIPSINEWQDITYVLAIIKGDTTKNIGTPAATYLNTTSTTALDGRGGLKRNVDILNPRGADGMLKNMLEASKLGYNLQR